MTNKLIYKNATTQKKKQCSEHKQWQNMINEAVCWTTNDYGRTIAPAREGVGDELMTKYRSLLLAGQTSSNCDNSVVHKWHNKRRT